MKKYIAIMIVFLLVCMFGINQASAVPTVMVYDGATLMATVVDEISDGVGPAADDSFVGLPGFVSYSGSFGVWSITVSTGQTKPFLGTAAVGQIDLNVLATSTGAGTLNVWFSEDFFAPPSVPAGLALSVGGTTIAPTGSMTTAFGYADAGNAMFGTGIPVGPVVGTGFFSGGANGLVGSSPVSMTLFTSIVHTGAGVTTVDSHQKVPEPATLLLMGAGLLGLGIFGRKRIKA